VNPVFFIVGGFALLALLESRHSAISSPGTIQTGSSVIGNPSGGLGSAGSDYATGEQLGLKAVAAIPVVGPALAQGASDIIGMITAHHKQALAAEGRALNDATPRLIQTFALIVQACAKGQITAQAQVNQLADRTVLLWYGEVNPIRRGSWPYTQAHLQANETYADSWKAGAVGVQHTQEAHPPDPCNAACVMGHYFAERGAWLVKFSCQDLLAGHHGSVSFPQIPAYATQKGYPQVSVTY
jgi:hypothetical protein